MGIIARILRTIASQLDNPGHKATGRSPDLYLTHGPAETPFPAVCISPDWLRSVGSLASPVSPAQRSHRPHVGAARFDEKLHLGRPAAGATTNGSTGSTSVVGSRGPDSLGRTILLVKIVFSATAKIADPAALDLGGALRAQPLRDGT